MKKNLDIGDFGFFSTIVVTVIGIGFFSYPRNLVELVDNDSLLVTILAGAINIALIIMICRISKSNNYEDLQDILKKNLGKILASIVLIVFSAYFTIAISFALRSFTEVIKMYLLQKTPTEFIIFVTLLVAYYHIRKNCENIIKFNEIMFFVMFIGIFFIMIFTLKQADFTNALPLGTSSYKDVVKSLPVTIFAFSGFEIAYFIIPYVKNKKNVEKLAIKSIIFVTVYYFLMLLICISVFSKNDVAKLMYSVITLVRVIDIPGAFVERWDGFAMILWVLFFYTTFVNTVYFASDTLGSAFKFKDIKIPIVIVIPLIYCLALYPESIIELNKMISSVVNYFSVFILIVLPIMLYGSMWIRRKVGSDEKK